MVVRFNGDSGVILFSRLTNDIFVNVALCFSQDAPGFTIEVTEDFRFFNFLLGCFCLACFFVFAGNLSVVYVSSLFFRGSWPHGWRVR